MKNEIETYLKSGNKLAFYMIAKLVSTFVGKITTTVKEIHLPIVLGEGGTFVSSYPLNTRDVVVNGKTIPKFSMVDTTKLVATKVTDLNKWLIAVANNLASGNFSAFGDTIDHEWIQNKSGLKGCRQTTAITTVKQAKEYLFASNHTWQNGDTRLERYLSKIEASQKNVKKKAYRENREVSFAEKQSTAPSINAEALKVLIDSGIKPADAVKMLQG